jgi:hypothetical protein
MKKIITFLSLTTLVATSVFAQNNYIPFKTDSVVWADQVSNGPISIEHDHYRPVGDTIINNISYAILTETRSTQNSPVPTFGNEDTIGFYRNDSINKKVFFLPVDSTAEELFYDFNLAVGDTLPETYFMRIKGYADTYVIDSIGDTTLADNVLRKMFYYNTSLQSLSHPDRKLVEGIGTLTGFTSNFEGFGLSNNQRLSCYKEAGNLVYSQGGCPPFPVSLNEVEIRNLSFTIYPNPSEGEFNLQFEKKVEKPEQLQITNMNGKAVNFKMFEKTDNQIEIRLNAPPGIYLLRLGSLGKKVIVW